jgi:multidrug resistance efflux pump
MMTTRPSTNEQQKRPGRGRLYVWVVVGVALLAVSLVGANAGLRSQNADQPAGGAATSPGLNPEIATNSFGHVDLENGVAQLYPALTGPNRLVKVHVKEGQEVAKDAPLLSLDNTLAKAQVKEAQADLDAARHSLDEARSLEKQHTSAIEAQESAISAVEHEREAAQTRVDRLKRLKDQYGEEDLRAATETVKKLDALKVVEEKKLAQLRAKNPQLAIDIAADNIKGKEGKLEEVKYLLRECELRAPADGKVLRVLVTEGDILGPQPRQPAIWFSPEGERIIRAEVEQEYAANVKPGQRVEVKDDSSGATIWKGKVRRVSDWYTHRRSILLDPGQLNDVRTLECIIELDKGHTLRIGQRVRVTIYKN